MFLIFRTCQLLIALSMLLIFCQISGSRSYKKRVYIIVGSIRSFIFRSSRSQMFLKMVLGKLPPPPGRLALHPNPYPNPNPNPGKNLLGGGEAIFRGAILQGAIFRSPFKTDVFKNFAIFTKKLESIFSKLYVITQPLPKDVIMNFFSKNNFSYKNKK